MRLPFAEICLLGNIDKVCVLAHNISLYIRVSLVAEIGRLVSFLEVPSPIKVCIKCLIAVSITRRTTHLRV